MVAAKRDIYDVEVMATLYSLFVVAELFPDRAVILRRDNRGVPQTLVRGTRWPLSQYVVRNILVPTRNARDPRVNRGRPMGKLISPTPPSRDCIFRNNPHSVTSKRCDIPNYLLIVLLYAQSTHRPSVSAPNMQKMLH